MTKRAKAAAKDFPNKIFVKVEVVGEESYLVADEETRNVEDGEKVAVYDLRQVLIKKVTHELTP